MMSLFEGLIGGGGTSDTCSSGLIKDLKFTIGGKQMEGFLTKTVKTDKQKAKQLQKRLV